jgi:hypothetical protein
MATTPGYVDCIENDCQAKGLEMWVAGLKMQEEGVQEIHIH